MSPARPRRERAFLLRSSIACLLACAACDSDFSPHWEEQLEELMDAQRPSPIPTPDGDAGQPDADMPTPPRPDSGVPQMPLFTCVREYLCDQTDPACPPVCLVASPLIDRCRPGDCRAEGFSPVRCEHCIPEPIK